MAKNKNEWCVAKNYDEKHDFKPGSEQDRKAALKDQARVCDRTKDSGNHR